jgi:uncharacterized sporulation protein YeaH/YhbH (DUF444 family)
MIRDITRDYDRYRKIGDKKRPDLKEFIQEQDLGRSTERKIKLPIKTVDIPSFEYRQDNKKKVIKVSGDGEDEEESDDGDQAGDGSGDHQYYDMSPEEFAKELEEELNLESKKRGKIKMVEDDEYTDIYKSGPATTLDFNTLFKKALKNERSSYFDQNFVRELLKVEDMYSRKAFEYCRNKNINVSKTWIDQQYDKIDNKSKWSSIEEFEKNVDYQRFSGKDLNDIRFRKEDERYKQPDTIEKEYNRVVIVNIRDVSGSMVKSKRELVERIFSPLDWYLQTKYDEAEFIYIAHDVEAWEVDRGNFFGIKSGGGTKISSAYELLEEIMENYPWESWNRYIFASGDGENKSSDSKQKVCPLIEKINANMHAYFQVGSSQRNVSGSHAGALEKQLNDEDNVFVDIVQDKNQVLDSIKNALKFDGDNND